MHVTVWADSDEKINPHRRMGRERAGVNEWRKNVYLLGNGLMYISWQYQSGEAGDALNRKSPAPWKTGGSASTGPILAYYSACLLQIDYLHIDEKYKTFRAPIMDI